MGGDPSGGAPTEEVLASWRKSLEQVIIILMITIIMVTIIMVIIILRITIIMVIIILNIIILIIVITLMIIMNYKFSVVADRFSLPNGPTKAVCCFPPLDKVFLAQIIIIIIIIIIIMMIIIIIIIIVTIIILIIIIVIITMIRSVTPHNDRHTPLDHGRYLDSGDKLWS